jgi:hypothetical protein
VSVLVNVTYEEKYILSINTAAFVAVYRGVLAVKLVTVVECAASF